MKGRVSDNTRIVHAVGNDFYLTELGMRKFDPVEPTSKYFTQPVSTAPSTAPSKFNLKQSPFGTDVQKYISFQDYSWSDNPTTVKVYVKLEGVGKLPTGNIRSKFGHREFELLVDDYCGK